MRYRNSREVLGSIKNITVSQKCGKWYVSIQTEREVAATAHPTNSAVGVDVGIARFATLSDGTVFESVNSFGKQQQRLARYQRAMARKVRFSNNWNKAKAKLTKLHNKIGNIRRDFLHKSSTTIIQNHAIVVIEDLKVTNMSRSASGTIDVLGSDVKAKSGLNRSILDQGWAEFRRQLEYKQAWRGGEVLAIPPHYTSQRCSCCGHVEKENRITKAKFACLSCGYETNADLNAAHNILAAGHAVLACGEMVQLGYSVKQEPAEGKHSISSEPAGILVL